MGSLASQSNPCRLQAFDSLRGIAAFAVLLGHTLAVCDWDTGFSTWPVIHNLFDGRAAVTMFFVLSGFVLTFGSLRSGKTMLLLPFYVRRLTRIVAVVRGVLPESGRETLVLCQSIRHPSSAQPTPPAILVGTPSIQHPQNNLQPSKSAKRSQRNKHTKMTPHQKEPTDARYVDENRNIFRGQKAIELIQERVETPVDPVKGVVKVDHDRWLEAQRYERRTWMEGIAAMSDRNEDHEVSFNRYQALDGKSFASAIELGCGPFTNMRKILSHCSIGEIHLLDPLANDYLEHPFCRYKGKSLGGIMKTSLIPWSPRGGLKHPFRFYKHKWNEWQIGGWTGRPITLHASTIEDFIPQRTYDLCVMINVIEHCLDIDQIFSRILEMTTMGSYFLFADKIYSAKEESESAAYMFDAGHPLRVDYSIIRNFLETHFTGIDEAEISVSKGNTIYKFNYYIGKRKSVNK